MHYLFWFIVWVCFNKGIEQWYVGLGIQGKNFCLVAGSNENCKSERSQHAGTEGNFSSRFYFYLTYYGGCILWSAFFLSIKCGYNSAPFTGI